MAKCYSAAVHPPRPARAVLMASRPEGEGKEAFEERTAAVVRLVVQPIPKSEADAGSSGDREARPVAMLGEEDQPQLLRRLDRDGKLVWQTRHPSLREAFWRAEWEYGVQQEEWKDEG